MGDDFAKLLGFIERRQAELGLTQLDVQRGAGIERSLFRRLAEGRGQLRHSTIHALAQVLETTEFEILCLIPGYDPTRLGPQVPRLPTREEIVDVAREQLGHDELLALVRERMRSESALGGVEGEVIDVGLDRGEETRLAPEPAEDDVVDVDRAAPEETPETNGAAAS